MAAEETKRESPLVERSTGSSSGMPSTAKSKPKDIYDQKEHNKGLRAHAGDVQICLK